MNFLIDGAIILATAWTRKKKLSWLRLVASATIGAVYVVFIFIPSMSFLYTFLVKIIFSVVMVAVAFGFGSLQHLLANLAAFYMVNFAIAGGVLGVNYLLQSSNQVLNGIWLTQSGGLRLDLKIGIVFIGVTIPILLWIYKHVFRSAKQRESRSNYLAQVTIRLGQFESSCTGLIDTGNQLYDPLTRTPVMVIEASLWANILPEKWLKSLQQADMDQIISLLDESAFQWQERLRLVPYRGINKAAQFMVAIKPDLVVIVHNEKTVESTKVLIGMDSGKLSAEGSYQAIIHPALIE